MNSNLAIEILQGEYWYGIRTNDGRYMPLSINSTYYVDIDPNRDCNQCVPFLMSTKGRYIWCDAGFSLRCEDRILKLASEKEKIYLNEGFKTLKGAFLDARKHYFMGNHQVPPKEFFINPQYNTWIELLYNQNQEDILNYAQSIIQNNFTPGILMIDDGWSEYYGRWDFNGNQFSDPKSMMIRLHEMGFKVMLWLCPFISPDSVEYRILRDKRLLILNQLGEPIIKKWWNGYSALLDLSHPETTQWLKKQLDFLKNAYDVDGFKFDAGDGSFYEDEDRTYGNISASEHTELWAQFGLNYNYNEYRACFKCGGMNLVQRLADKNHSWEFNGLSSLIPNSLLQGLLGYAYLCPDMIGGGEYENFLKNAASLDEELFVRYAQCSALMPMMQFSAAPWRVLTEENVKHCLTAAKIHERFADEIYSLALHASETGEPIVRYMAYEYPEQGFEEVTNQFMLGDSVLVAPVLCKGERQRRVVLPAGVWRYVDGSIYEGNQVVVVNAPLEVLPYFQAIHVFSI